MKMTYDSWIQIINVVILGWKFDRWVAVSIFFFLL